MNILDRIHQTATASPNRSAYLHEVEGISYGELWDRASEYAELLCRQGSGEVILYGHKDVDMLVSILACMIANRPYIPIDTYMPLSRIERIISLTGAELVISNSKELPFPDITVTSLSGLEGFRDNDKIEFSNHIVYMIFTSGSTGDPKGVPISWENLTSFADWISGMPPLDSYREVRVLNQASFSFDLSVADIIYSLCNGHTLVAMDSSLQGDVSLIADFFMQNPIDVTVTTPTFMKLCLLNKEFNCNNLPALKCMYFCGEQLELETVIKIRERFPNCAVINAYGPTEAASAVSAAVIEDEDLEGGGLLPVGIMGRNATDIRIEESEIILSGRSVFGGYLGDIKGGYYKENGINCYRTGDKGYIKNGKLYCNGRIDSQIKLKGYRIELNDIESNLKSLKGVLDAAVVAKYGKNNTVKLIKGFAVCENNITSDDLKRELALRLPQYMIPSQIRLLDSLPVNENKKIDRRRLSEL